MCQRPKTGRNGIFLCITTKQGIDDFNSSYITHARKQYNTPQTINIYISSVKNEMIKIVKIPK